MKTNIIISHREKKDSQMSNLEKIYTTAYQCQAILEKINSTLNVHHQTQRKRIIYVKGTMDKERENNRIPWESDKMK